MVVSIKMAGMGGRSRNSNGDAVVQELIRVAMQRLPKRVRSRVTKKHILKTLFLARENLPDENSVKPLLAYYWYLEGPYSETIYANLDKMVSAGRVDADKTSNWETYRLVPEYALKQVAPHSDDVKEASIEIGRVADDFASVDDAVRRAYEAAPFKWYTTYNLEFKPKFERHCRDVLAGRNSKYADRDILEWLDDAVLDYPTVPEFVGHRMIFMDFAKMLNAFLRWDSYHTRKDVLGMLQVLCGDIWEVFAYGVRVYHHDPYYDSHVDRWRAKYKLELGKLDRTTLKHAEEFDDVVVDETRLAPNIEDMVLHPERHGFRPMTSCAAAGTS